MATVSPPSIKILKGRQSHWRVLQKLPEWLTGGIVTSTSVHGLTVTSAFNVGVDWGESCDIPTYFATTAVNGLYWTLSCHNALGFRLSALTSQSVLEEHAA
eukprot:2108491-Amphidinium_carterae.1